MLHACWQPEQESMWSYAMSAFVLAACSGGTRGNAQIRMVYMLVVFKSSGLVRFTCNP